MKLNDENRDLREGGFNRSSQHASIRRTETVALDGLTASIGSVGDAYDSAGAETVMGLFTNDAIRNGSAFRTGPLKVLPDVEEVTFDWVSWCNNESLHSFLAQPWHAGTTRARNSKQTIARIKPARQLTTPPSAARTQH